MTDEEKLEFRTQTSAVDYRALDCGDLFFDSDEWSVRDIKKPKPRIHEFMNLKCCKKGGEPFKTLVVMWISAYDHTSIGNYCFLVIKDFLIQILQILQYFIQINSQQWYQTFQRNNFC